MRGVDENICDAGKQRFFHQTWDEALVAFYSMVRCFLEGTEHLGDPKWKPLTCEYKMILLCQTVFNERGFQAVQDT
jgi:hypothetical protein